jgi:hypothetical protein
MTPISQILSWTFHRNHCATQPQIPCCHDRERPSCLPVLPLKARRIFAAQLPLIAIENEPPAKLIVDPPLPEPLAAGKVFIQYRTENLRVVPVFGKGALSVSPRIGHIHITVDDLPWHFVDASGETIILVGLPPGPAQGPYRAGRSHAQSNHQQNREASLCLIQKPTGRK